MHEHVFVIDPEAHRELRAPLGRELLGRGRAGRRRDREAAAAARRRHRDDRRPDRRSASGATSPASSGSTPRSTSTSSSPPASTPSSSCRASSAYRSDDWLVELFVREIREGIDDTGVKAAFLKCAVEEHGIVGDIPRILAAVAAAARRDGRSRDGAHERGRPDGAARARDADEGGRRSRGAS